MDTSTPMASMVFAVMAALAQMELDIEAGEPATQAARDLGMSRATLSWRIRGLAVSG